MSMSDWADRYLAAKQVIDMRADPAESKLTVQTEEAGSGVLVPVGRYDMLKLKGLYLSYWAAFLYLRKGGSHQQGFPKLTSTMWATLNQAKHTPAKFKYITIAPRDYTIYTAPHVEVPIISIHTKPERSWFLVVKRGDLLNGVPIAAWGAQLGRMRVYPATDQGVFPFNIRTNWRALIDTKKLKEVQGAYWRLVYPPR